MAAKKKAPVKHGKNTVDRGRHFMSQAFIDARWQPGETGNPKGRPPAGWTWAELIREYGDMECPPKFAQGLGLGKNPKWKQVVVAMAFCHAAKGNASIIRTLIEYIDGRPPVEVNSNFNVAEQLKREAAEQGIDWQKNPGLAMLIAAEEALALKPGEV